MDSCKRAKVTGVMVAFTCPKRKSIWHDLGDWVKDAMTK
jgi:hypothetical protein